MTVTTLYAAAGVAVAIAAVYAYIGLRISQRRVSQESRSASRAFTAWWMGLSANTALGGLQALLAAAGVTGIGPHITLTFVTFLVLSVALWGLLYYLVYLYTGSSGWMVPLAFFYLAYYLAIVGYLWQLGPQGVDVSGWTVSLSYAQEPTGPLATVLLVLLVGPQLLASLAYFSLIFKVQDRTRRYRVLLVSLAILTWFGSTLIASFTGAGGTDLWQIASRAIGLAAALSILAAYFPPRWVQDRFEIRKLQTGAEDNA